MKAATHSAFTHEFLLLATTAFIPLYVDFLFVCILGSMFIVRNRNVLQFAKNISTEFDLIWPGCLDFVRFQ